MRRSRGTDSETLAAAVREYEAPLLRYAASITGDAEQARDVVQEAFIALYESDGAAISGRLAPWLYTVVRNRAINVRKKEARMMPLSVEHADTLEAAAAPPGAAAAARETQEIVADALGRLPDEQREVCRLKFQAGLTYREISDTMNISLGKVSNLIAQALENIRLELKAESGLTQEG